MRFLVVILVIGLLAACTDGSEVVPRPHDVAVSTRLEVDSRDRLPIAVETRALSRTEEAWAAHQVVISSAQPGRFVAIMIPSQVFNAEPGTGVLTPVEPLVERREAFTPSFAGLAFEVRVGGKDGLLPGSHEFRLLIPVWLDVNSFEALPPDGSLTIVFTYLVIDPGHREPAQPFCDVAIPRDEMINPTPAELSQIAGIAQAVLPQDQAEEVTVRATELASHISEFDAGHRSGFSTWRLAEIVGAICGVELTSVAAAR